MLYSGDACGDGLTALFPFFLSFLPSFIEGDSTQHEQMIDISPRLPLHILYSLLWLEI